MSDFLERLERELTEAIERRGTVRSRRWRRRWWPPRVGSVVVAAALAFVVAGVVLIALIGGEDTATPPPARTAPAPARPVPPGTPLRLRGVVERLDARTWRGDVDGPGGKGLLVITGPALFSRHCCEFPPRVPVQTIRYVWTVPGGSLTGCVRNRIVRRPRGRWVWDGPGRVTAATGTLRRYAGADLAFGGHTNVSSPDRTLIVLGDDGRPPGKC